MSLILGLFLTGPRCKANTSAYLLLRVKILSWKSYVKSIRPYADVAYLFKIPPERHGPSEWWMLYGPGVEKTHPPRMIHSARRRDTIQKRRIYGPINRGGFISRFLPAGRVFTAAALRPRKCRTP
ncbi:hypothetical protein CDAR_384961 [Caerostris darwini]|uniref:Uncharacterized protein n=1 Tax=Caerostris darwini TaxID=1538125 RepID=A0AAV4WDM2_9ARAC|nr:hypothetical protein CDAR_384961 [Caerostris darwini]